MEEKKNMQRKRPDNRGGTARKKKNKKMSYRKKIVMFQIGAITLAIFLMLMIGAVILTRLFADGNQKSE